MNDKPVIVWKVTRTGKNYAVVSVRNKQRMYIEADLIGDTLSPIYLVKGFFGGVNSSPDLRSYQEGLDVAKNWVQSQIDMIIKLHGGMLP